MSRLYAVASALTLASAMGFNSEALAQTVDIPFTASVPIEVTFDQVVLGTVETTASGGSVQLPSAGAAQAQMSVSPLVIEAQANQAIAWLSLSVGLVVSRG